MKELSHVQQETLLRLFSIEQIQLLNTYFDSLQKLDFFKDLGKTVTDKRVIMQNLTLFRNEIKMPQRELSLLQRDRKTGLTRRTFLRQATKGAAAAMLSGIFKKASAADEEVPLAITSKTRPTDTFRVRLGKPPGYLWMVLSYYYRYLKSFAEGRKKPISKIYASKKGKGPLIVILLDHHIGYDPDPKLKNQTVQADFGTLALAARDEGLELIGLEGWLGPGETEQEKKTRGGEDLLLAQLIDKGYATKFGITPIALENRETHIRARAAYALSYHYELQLYSKTPFKFAYAKQISKAKQARDQLMKQLDLQPTEKNMKKLRATLEKYLKVNDFEKMVQKNILKDPYYNKIILEDRNKIAATKFIAAMKKNKRQQGMIFFGALHVAGLMKELRKITDCDIIILGEIPPEVQI
tara:strand:+ start:463 stop:1695 length:1233 start_codon:yes stop_codon:yes gene_type:complete